MIIYSKMDIKEFALALHIRVHWDKCGKSVLLATGRLIGGSPHKGQVIWKAFICPDFIMNVSNSLKEFIAYRSGHKGGLVLLPCFAIKW